MLQGNLQSIAATTNTSYTGCTVESGFSQTADASNHLSGFAYDASGNANSDGINVYVWNAESQLKSGGGVSYLYDVDGQRRAKAGSKLYWYGPSGEVISETDTTGHTTADYIFFAGKHIGTQSSSGVGSFYVEDFLGTSRVLTTTAGVVCYDADFYPYGGERAYTNTCPQNYKFEGKERDTETGNDAFGARYYSNRYGRWLSSDWSVVPVPVPYANLTNPQTLNLYSMVADDPESFADLSGHDGPGLMTAIEEVTMEEVDAIAEPLISSAAGSGPGAGIVIGLGGAGLIIIDSFTRLSDAKSNLKMEEAKAINDVAIRRAKELAAQRGRGNKRQTQFEGLTDDEVSRIARDKNDPRREAAKTEEKSRHQRRSRDSRDDKKKKKVPPPTKTNKPDAKPAPAKPDPAKPDPAKPDPAKPDPTQS